MSSEESILDPQRFDAVARNEAYADAMAYEPPTPEWFAVAVAGTVMASVIAFAIFGLAMIIGSGAPFLFVLAWAATIGGILSVAVALFRRAWKFHKAPITRHVAVVLDKRFHVTGGESSTSTSYFTTLVLADRTRFEVHTPADLTGLLTRGDIGVAYLKLTTLVAFRRFDC
jgi:hypothetical protein